MTDLEKLQNELNETMIIKVKCSDLESQIQNFNYLPTGDILKDEINEHLEQVWGFMEVHRKLLNSLIELALSKED